MAWASERMRQQTSQLLISCNRNLNAYAAYADAVFSDRWSGFQGPLAGLEALPGTLTQEFLLLVPCDTPRLPLDLGAQLYQALTSKPALYDLAYATAGGRHHYLHALLRRRCLNSLPAYLDAGGRSVRDWYETLRCVSVEFAGARAAFANHNDMPAQT